MRATLTIAGVGEADEKTLYPINKAMNSIIIYRRDVELTDFKVEAGWSVVRGNSANQRRFELYSEFHLGAGLR